MTAAFARLGRRGPILAFVGILALGALGFVRSVHFYGSFFHNIIDARTYYVTARSLAVDGDLQIDDDLVQSPERPPANYQPPPTSRPPGHGQPVSREPAKYPVGLSLVEVPFIELARAIRGIAALCGLSSAAPPGFSWFEMLFVGLCLVAIFAGSLTLVCTMVADEFGVGAALVGVAAAWFGTSLFYYSSLFPFMAHATSFAALAVVMWATRALRAPGSINGLLVIFGMAVGAELLIRPQQVVVAVASLPVVLAAIRHRPVREWRLGALLVLVVPACALLAQTLELWLRSGRISLTTYGAFGEAFSFAHPRFDVVLWSIRAGLIRFSPVVLVAGAGYVLRPRAIPGWVWPSVANALIQVYLVASWWAPGQGETFGARMWSDNAAVVAFGVAALVRDSRPMVRRASTVAALIATGWTVIQLSRYVGWPR